MLDRKTTPRRRLGLIALTPMVTAIMLASTAYAAVDAKAPTCKILAPKKGIALSANQNVSFAAQATLKDKTASPLTYEWDFSGGVFGELIPNSNPPAYKRPDSLKTTVQFVRDNSTYRVHFRAIDAQRRMCDASIDVTVGNVPKGLPNMSKMTSESQKNAPKVGNQLVGNSGDIVVLPYPGLTMLQHTDSRYQNNLYSPDTPAFNSINAQVYSKDRKPVKLTQDDVLLKYAAASNKTDPTGVNSINSTSQNYPLGKKGEVVPLQDALIQKTDAWELPPAREGKPSDYMRMSFMDGFPGGSVQPDEGFKVSERLFKAKHGSYMPGINNPFVSNEFQDFSGYNESTHSFVAQNIPVTDIDDTGKVNPYPLMRVEAVDAATKEPIANAVIDTVITAAKDFHCSECHAKGKIAANPEIDYGKFVNAYHSSPEYNNGYTCKLPACTDTNGPISQIQFYDAVDKNGKPSDNLADKEYAAIKNANALHDFYDNLGLNFFMEKDSGGDMVANCNWCHASMINPLEKMDWGFNNNSGKKPGDMQYYPTVSEAMHKFHNKLQLDPKDKTKILREKSGRPLQWDDSKGANPNSLFPTVDAKGQSLPMEESCLRCHSGHREQSYRDRMYTAGATCFDCHGDMSAVGKAHDKPKAGTEGSAKRIEWLEQPDCGSCHMGDGNLGKSGTGKGGTSEAFSSGVMRRAFDSKDPSATTRKPLTQRFAVQPPSESILVDVNDWVDSQYSTRHSILKFDAPLYRKSKDTHGDVACGACHGGSHEIWANRDPKSNDNVTAMQLQGHTGLILECNVCHTTDAFKYEADLDGGIYMTDVSNDSGVLGGPHNMHPVNDAYWWKTSQNSADKNADKTTYGGWHNNYAKKPGKDGEDQCAACHGNDHKGTRLSKTPVDRTFDFSKFDSEKLKAAGFKNSVIKVKAGTEIGCDTCHSIQTSCIGSPAGAACGVASENFVMPKNHDPVISSNPAKLTAVMGEAFSYQVKASDADGDTLTYSLGLKPTPAKDKDGKIVDDMKIDSNGLITTNWSDAFFADYKYGPFEFPFAINVSDGKGGYTTQSLTMTLECPKGKSWQYAGGMWDGRGSCIANTDVSITSKPPVGIDSGAEYSYQVTATDAKKSAITYSLMNAPDDVTIDAKTGFVKWTAHTVWYGQLFYQVKATNANGVFDTQAVTLTVCVPTKKWDAKMEMCM